MWGYRAPLPILVSHCCEITSIAEKHELRDEDETEHNTSLTTDRDHADQPATPAEVTLELPSIFKSN